MPPGGGGNIKVVVRVRPFNGREKERNAELIVQMSDNQTTLTPPGDAAGKAIKGANETRNFAFDKSYWSFDKAAPNYAGQEDLYTDLGIPLLDNAFGGYNNCIFAYGQTGSGKSYSMMGYGEEHGIIPKICQNMFNRIDEIIAKDPGTACTVEVSYLEIYNEKVRDLLNPSNKGNLKVREHPSTGPYVEDLSKLAVRSFSEIENLMDEGNKARTVAATNMNETSSRSHSVFTLLLTQKRHDQEVKMSGERVAKISLVDLAGSERATSTGATGARLKEGAEINKSLSSLGRVIAALADMSSGKKKGAKGNTVPYRDSVLTWLLKDSLGGNSMTAMIAAISPADINYEETLSTLRYADSAKRIKNHAVVNEDPNARMIRELKEELAQLRSKLGGAGGSGGSAPGEGFDPNVPLDQQFISIVQEDGTTKKVSRAEIADQLSQSEKLYSELNQTWEEKLANTQRVQKEREQALEELGISIEKGFVGMSTPKKMPHLINLSDDPMLAGCLVYNLKPGKMVVGNADVAAPGVEIRIAGTKILPEHCTFENVEGVVTITPNEGAAVMVNGQRIEKTERLKNGMRLILGDFHIFRFNNPQEPKEKPEPGRSLLRHSVTASQLSSPSSKPSHDRSLSTVSGFDSDFSRSESPVPSTTGMDSDWSFARREAAVAILGLDQKINHLTDEELESLFDDVQRARDMRRGIPDSRTLSPEAGNDSDSSAPVREKYLSGQTLDSFSLDTALTMPGTPQVDGDPNNQMAAENLAKVQGSLQAQLEKHKEEYQEQLRQAQASSQDVEQLREDKQRMEDDLRTIKEEMQAQLRKQKEDFEKQIRQMLMDAPAEVSKKNFQLWSLEDKSRATLVIDRWRQLKNIAMAEVMLRKAALLKEAQVLASLMKKPVNLQFMVVEQGQDICSSYDQVLNDVTNDDDEALFAATKPFVAVRVMDSQAAVIHLWSLDKLEQRVQTMRQMYQYHDRPDYMQHFRLQNPFTESFMPQYTLVGNAHIPLTAVFEMRVQDYAVHVDSPYTHQAIGVIRLSLEPSAGEAPPNVIKFVVVMHDMVGFAEREGTEVHAQLYIPGINEEGATTTQMISGFDEEPVRFESVHSMSLPQDSPKKSSLVVAIFAKITPMHLDMISSWDEMREASEQPVKPKRKPEIKSRIAETHFLTEEQHDVFAKVQIMEMSEMGKYEPVEVEQQDVLDKGTYQLHQGLQRRVVLNITHTTSDPLHWQGVASMRVGNLRLVDPNGKEDNSGAADIPLKFVHEPQLREEASGTTHITVIGQWDSSMHDTSLLDRPTADRYSVRFTLSCDATCKRTESLLTFNMEQTLQIKPRAWIRPQALFKQLWAQNRVVRSSATIFSITLTPAPSKRAEDLWRLSSRNQYIKGEETLNHWQPRGISLIKDFMAAHQKRQRLIEVDAAKASLARLSPLSPALTEDWTDPDEERELTDEQKTLLGRTLDLWQKPMQSLNLSPLNTLTTPPTSPGSVTPNGQAPPRLFPTIIVHPKNPLVLKAGPILAPATLPFSGSWTRRTAELRPPYLHLYSVPDGEELHIINLRNATVDSEPEVGRLLQGDRIHASNVFAVYGTGMSWMFAARNEQAKGEWILAIDTAFMGPNGPNEAGG